MMYVLDTNFFVQAHRVLYPLDVAVTFGIKFEILQTKG